MMSDKPLKVIAGTPDKPLVIGDIEIDCYVLEDETRVLSQRGMASGLGMSSTSGHRLTRFINSKNLKPFISNELSLVIESPIQFEFEGRTASGYPATLLVDLCNVVLEARTEEALQKQQAHIAERAELLLRGLATVGIIALIDEATGYQELRDRNALNKFLEQYLLSERAKWAKRFPDEFYMEIFRLRGWPWQGMKVNRPQVVAHYTNDVVWDRLAPGVRDELERLNPKTERGTRRARHHQWLTNEIGHPALQIHINGVIVLMKSVIQAKGGWDEFKRRLQRVFPKIHINLDLPLDED